MFICSNSNQVQPWNSTLPTLLHLLPKCKTFNDVNQIHARLITTGLINNTTFTTKIVLTFSSSTHTPLIQFARHLFFTRHAFPNHPEEEQNKEEDPFLWNAVLKSYSHGSNPRHALVLFCLMIENRVSMDKFSFSLVLKACCRVGVSSEGMQIHGFLSKIGIRFRLNLFLQNCLIALYLKFGFLGFARQVFDKMIKRDSVSYNSMISGYSKHGLIESARELFDSMPIEDRNLISWNSMITGYVNSEDGLYPARKLFDEMPKRDLISWNTMIDGFVKSLKMDDARVLFDIMPKRDVITWATMIDGYAKLGRIDLAKRLFDEMPLERDIVSCNAMMAGYIRNCCYVEALDIFYSMESGTNSLSPDETTFSVVISAIAQLGQLDKGKSIHRYLIENRFRFDGKLGVAIIDMYSKCGCIRNAITVFDELKDRKTLDHWNAMINGLAIHGMGDIAFELVIKMEKLSVVPDDITFIGLLNACSHSGLVKEGFICFELMRRKHKLEPRLQHYGCMVDILGRAGYLEEAFRFIESMPVEPNDVIWRSLASACNVHMNFDMGEPVAKHLIGLDSRKSNSYVILSNMYAGLGLWDDVSRIRRTMKNRKLRKIAGRSWIELEGIVHEFLVQDKTHPQVREIYSLLDSL